ncbi:ATPase F0 complex, subunit B [Rhodopirellula sp. SWK7]|uniref:F0F1 ATP synthase subunit B family protein n=1 Tax=Rhodopirellula sp. SWK7 TaxID=595460 RepID=UPI0002BDC511|nr:ATPase F0 complex, subunit B [Rhodopirellula sp. SWK7]EMI47029.1 Alternate ATPase, F0 complex, subunit B [Rhodopirellula sp. SWK7]
MLIDWFTVAAQAVNFLVLVWLLKRFLYKPILDAIDARENRIAAELADADAKRAEASREREDFQQKNHTFDQQRESMLTKAKDEAATERARLLEEARRESEVLRAKRSVELKDEEQNLNDEINRRTQQEVFALTRKTLQDLAGENLEERMCDVFTQRLRTMNDETKQELAISVETAKQSPRVRSAFVLPPVQRANIQTTLNEMLSADTEIRYEIAPGLISGIELLVNGRKISWSVNEYLDAMEMTAKK